MSLDMLDLMQRLDACPGVSGICGGMLVHFRHCISVCWH